MWLNSEDGCHFISFALDAAFATKKVRPVIEYWQVAAKAAHKALKMVTAAKIELLLASIFSDFLKHHAKAVKQWENIMSTYASSKDDTEIGFVKLMASSRLARHYLLEAVNAGIGTPEAEESAKKLEKLTMQAKGDENSNIFTLLGAFSLGTYYRLKGQQTKARAIVRPSIRHGVHSLSGDDPENDVMSLRSVFIALLAVRDTTSLITVAYALGTYEEDEPDESEMMWTCEGPCHRDWPNLDNGSLCSICADWFCQDCVKSLAEGTMARNQCNAIHVKSFVHIPPRPKKVSKGSVLVDGEEMSFGAWKNLLRKEWGV